LAGTFDFAPASRVVTEVPPNEPTAMDFNGWQFTAKPKVPYRPSFKIMLYGIRWYMGNNILDVTTNPSLNAGRLLNFYKTNRMHGIFAFNHEYLGSILGQFEKPVIIPPAQPNSKGLTEPFEVNVIQYNPPW
jgi:hypothetical protein